ncbi:hypothetical protein DFR70_1011011 [Nocardia tenerifensis]|uniref:Uncharacterized protein n=1 Tax=Nocardia tenerifensis TaxID=228006 RepID=A0A318KCM0_9NOCA|nr:hypothetical protein [Nocardia tenerifensis]PXX71577.1 hypothetical protein DFR70_1011011 [Nocardia tenerifensis]
MPDHPRPRCDTGAGTAERDGISVTTVPAPQPITTADGETGGAAVEIEDLSRDGIAELPLGSPWG